MKGAVFDIHGIRVRMEYRRIKNINLYVRPEQDEALVTVPFRTPRERVERFLYEKEGCADIWRGHPGIGNIRRWIENR